VKLASCACEELVLLRCHELLVVAAGAAQVGSKGPPLVDNHDALVRSARCAPVVLAVLHFLLLVLPNTRLVRVLR